MNTTTIKQLKQLNIDFYQHIATDFDRTRQNAWEGWQQLLPYIQKLRKLQVLDLGCGNGRFAKFICEHKLPLDIFAGIDSDQQLLTIAQKSFPDHKVYSWNKLDLLGLLHSDKNNKETYNLLVCFGVMHHIPSYTLRLQLLQYISQKATSGALIACSFWQYHLDERFKKKIIPWSQFPQIDQSQLEANDFLVSWGNDQQTPRYVHSFDDQELDQLITDSGLELLRRYQADGKDHNLNQYLLCIKR